MYRAFIISVNFVQHTTIACILNKILKYFYQYATHVWKTCSGDMQSLTSVFFCNNFPRFTIPLSRWTLDDLNKLSECKIAGMSL